VKQIAGRELARLIQQRGWTIKRIQGGHHIFGAVGRRERLIIPIHGIIR
jgi:predicted RNA binding protein YcfA (HicA-like mRNA interferase family)